MGLIRLLMLLAIGYFVWLNVKVYFRKQERRTNGTADGSREPITVVKCPQCQIHLPQNEAIADGNQWFCSEEHRRHWLMRQR